MGFYEDDSAVRAVTSELVSHGHEVLQIFKAGADDRGHVSWLLSLFRPEAGAHILDLGCGVGAVARIMSDLRPDLHFTLLNKSASQLDMCPAGMPIIQADMNAIPEMGCRFDAAMALYSIGHADLGAVMIGAFAALDTGGVFFIYDLASDDPNALRDALDYEARPPSEVFKAAHAAGFDVMDWGTPADPTPERFMEIMPADVFETVFRDVSPVYYRLVRR